MAHRLELAAFEAVEQIKTAPDTASVRRHVLQYAETFGFDSFVITELPPVGFDFGAHIILSAWPQNWHRRYTSQKHYDHDPIAREAWRTVTPFVWSRALAQKRLSKCEERVMAEAASFGLCDGFMVPLHTITGFSTCISYAGPQAELPPRATDALYLVAIHAYEAADRLKDTTQPPSLYNRSGQKLTQREREVLGWVACGHTDEDIGTICGITRKTVSAHVTNAAQKLGAHNRTHATAKALIAGEIKASDLS